MFKLKSLVVLSCLFCLVGCGEQALYSDLTEKDANEIIALLQRTGIPAVKQGGAASLYSIKVSGQYFASAVDTLNAAGLPRKQLKTLGDVFEKEGFVSSPLEERARLNFAQSQELTKTIESIDGVVMARVHLAVPEHDPLAEEQKPSSASVFVKYNPEIDMNKREAQVKSLLVNSIEGMLYENVTVVMVPAEIKPMEKITASVGNNYLLELLAGITAFLLCVLGYLLWYLKKANVLTSRENSVIPLFNAKKGLQKWDRRKAE